MYRNLIALSLAALLLASTYVRSQELDPAIAERVSYVADVQKFQGMFDSVVEFCEPHVPNEILQMSRTEWMKQNGAFLALRDKELGEVIGYMKEFGKTAEDIEATNSWFNEQYTSRLAHDRLYKDIATSGNLLVSCSNRLGAMVSESMALKHLSPEAYKYATSRGEP